jgi:hypothetical protein
MTATSSAPARGQFSLELATWRALGPWNGFLSLVHRLLVRISASRIRLIRYFLVVQPVEPAADARTRRSQIEVRELREDDPQLAVLPRPAVVMRDRFARNGRCIGAFEGTQFAAMGWFQLQDYDEDEVRCSYRCVPAGRVSWDYDLLIADRFRLTPLFARLWAAANSMLHASGIAWSASRISAFNSASIRSHARLGARRVATVTFLCVGPLQLMLGGCRPYLHFSRRGRGPELEIDARRKGSPL